MGCSHSGVANVQSNKAKVTPSSILKSGDEVKNKKGNHPVGLVQKNPNSPSKKLKFADDLKTVVDVEGNDKQASDNNS